jgi:hypothetical protein
MEAGGPGAGGPESNRPGPQAGDRPDASAGTAGETPGGAPGSKSKTGMSESEGATGKAKGDHDGKTGWKAEGDTGDKSKTGMSESEIGNKSKTGKAEGDFGDKSKTGTAEGQTGGKSGKSVRLETQDVSKVRTYFSKNRPSVKSIDKTQVSVSIGIALPGTIALYDLPSDVIVVSGACPIKYFVWGDDIVLVDSCTREVVEIIVGVA